MVDQCINSTAANPVLVRSVDAAPATQPFQTSLHFNFEGGSLYEDYSFFVPTGYRLVIEWVSGGQFVAPGGTGSMSIDTTFSGTNVHNYFLTSAQIDVHGNNTITTAQKTLIYADPGSRVTVTMGRSTNQGSQLAVGAIAGRLEAVQ